MTDNRRDPSPSEQAEVIEQGKSVRYLMEVPDTYAIARWPRDADVSTIARCILGTLKYEPHSTDTTPLRLALERLIEGAPMSDAPDKPDLQALIERAGGYQNVSPVEWAEYDRQMAAWQERQRRGLPGAAP